MKSIAVFAVISFAATAAPLDHCIESNYVAVVNLTQASPFFSSCAIDSNITTEKLSNKVIPSAAQGDKFIASANCQALFKDMQTLSALQRCLELSVVPNVTWSMVASAVKVAVYPTVPTPCDFAAIQKSAMGLITKLSVLMCLPSMGMNLAKLSEIPPVAKLENARKNSRCRDAYGAVQTLIKGFPHCSVTNMSATTFPGLDIHAFETLSFDSALDMLQLASTFQTQVARQAKLSAVEHNMPVVVVLRMMAGAIMAFVVVVAYQARSRRGYTPI
ncbi:hypothetical protein DYB37_004975 [Aphanomyces astaci]|uniref:Elicitin-like protein n=1 Tax=Aphanomyces astaci TaxID=112090 RepID=A0A3R7B805_APHAT|nr:hypothetical protein DYB35_004266 [Aphanomyces astaci]RHZ17189.1 hypothetical protein DYB37_004975 [Aphanomyces astaci]